MTINVDTETGKASGKTMSGTEGTTILKHMHSLVGKTLQIEMKPNGETKALPIPAVTQAAIDALPIQDAVLDTGRRRFRPVILNSITTIAGVLPILLETQRQALVLIPMATSLAFGLMFATAILLILVPTLLFLTQGFGPVMKPASYRNSSEIRIPDQWKPALPSSQEAVCDFTGGFFRALISLNTKDLRQLPIFRLSWVQVF